MKVFTIVMWAIILLYVVVSLTALLVSSHREEKNRKRFGKRYFLDSHLKEK